MNTRGNDASAPQWRWFAVWLVLGATCAVALVGAASVGIFVAPVAVAATAFVATRRRARGGIPGLLCGLGVPLLVRRLPEPSRTRDGLHVAPERRPALR